MLSASQALELGTQFQWSNGTLIRPYVRGGATFFDNTEFALEASFEGSADGVGPFRIRSNTDDVVANLPFVKGCGLWFDHHSSETERLMAMEDLKFEGESRSAPSCSRVIYDYYGGHERFAHLDETGLVDAADKADTADFTVEEIVNPTGWVLLSYIMDARTGLGRYRDYRISNY